MTQHTYVERDVVATARSPRSGDGADTVDLGDLNDGRIVGVQTIDGGDIDVTVRLAARGVRAEAGARRRPPEVTRDWWGEAERRETISVEHDLAHDPDARLFYLGGRPLELAPQEYRLLRFLAERPGRLLTHAQILEGAWPDGLATDVHPLQAMVSRLRRQLGPAASLIRTRRPIGYLFALDRSVGGRLVSKR